MSSVQPPGPPTEEQIAQLEHFRKVVRPWVLFLLPEVRRED